MKNNQLLEIQLPIQRDPRVASTLSVIPGLGQIYNLEPRKGVLFFMVGLTNLFLIVILSWSRQLVESMQAASLEFNITPNKEIVHALSGFHTGSPAMTVLALLFLAFVAFAMRDAHDRAQLVRKNTIYAPPVMHLSEATSGSYLFHATLMATLVVFAFFFLLPTPPSVQVTDIEFVTTQTPTKKIIRTNTASDKMAEAVKNPRIKDTSKNPASGSAGGGRPTTSRPARPPAPPQTVQKQESKPEAPPQKATATTQPPERRLETPAKPVPKPSIPAASNAAAPAPHMPVQQAAPSTTLPAMAMPQAKQTPQVNPASLLANLINPHTAPVPAAPQVQNLSVKSMTGAPQASSQIQTSTGNTPAPAIASSQRSSLGIVPNIIESTGRPSATTHSGPSPSSVTSQRDAALGGLPTPVSGSKGHQMGRSTSAPSPQKLTGPGNDPSGDIDRFIASKPSVGPAGNGPSTATPGNNDQSHAANPTEGINGEHVQKPTRPVDFGPYMAALQRRIKQAWFPPKEATTKRVTVRFAISKNGSLSDLALSHSSGSSIADQCALKAVSNAAPFAPLPVGAPESVDIEFTFDYNVFRGTGQFTRTF